MNICLYTDTVRKHNFKYFSIKESVHRGKSTKSPQESQVALLAGNSEGTNSSRTGRGTARRALWSAPPLLGLELRPNPGLLQSWPSLAR